MTTELFANTPTPGTAAPITTLTANGGSITSGATSFNVGAPAPAALQGSGQFRILIDSEYMIVTGGASTTTWTVTRGAEGSTAASHTDNTSIYHLVTAGALANLVANAEAASDPVGTASGSMTAHLAAINPHGDRLTPRASGPINASNSPYTIPAGELTPVDLSSGAVTLKLSNAPVDETICGYKVVKLPTSGSNSLTVQTQGSDVFEIAAGSTSGTTPVPILGQTKQYMYKNSSAIWYACASDNPLGQLDQRYYHTGASHIDMCAAPYNHAPGDDVTADMQTVINTAVTNGIDTTIYFSRPGTYNLNGAQQSGTAFSASYSGQILAPANTGAPVTIRFLGVSPASPPFTDSDLFTAGTVLASNATSGAVFDAIPAKNVLLPETQVRFIFEDIWITVPSDPQCWGVIGDRLETLQFKGNGGVCARLPLAAPTGTGAGISFGPVQTNSPQQIQGYVQVVGFNKGVRHNEHFTVAGTLQCSNCTIAVDPGGGGTARHWSRYQRLLIQGCGTGIQPSFKAQIDGFIDIGDNGGWSFTTTNVVSDASNNLYGELVVAVYQDTYPPPGVPVLGATNLNIVRAPLGKKPDYPWDDFTRMSSTSSSNYLGATPTGHVWSYLTGGASNWTIASNSLKANLLTGGSLKALLPMKLGRPGASRNIHALVTPTGTFNQVFLINNVVSGSNAGNYLYVQLHSGGFTIGKVISGTGTALATSTSSSLLTAGTQYTLDMAFSNPVAGPASLTLLLNGAQVPLTIAAGGTSDGASISGNSFVLSSSESAQLVDTDPRLTQDGIQATDTTSTYNYFAVQPL